ncbi:hypothetical protein NKI38_32170, partial [Mesorhizobium sp. M0621]|uniref:hypothetical protein n=1 Tax=Mesorhizobium sp. M0621 TaxID=2956974 RepID=UPI00333C759C
VAEGFFVPLDRSLPTPAQAGRRLERGLFTVDYIFSDEPLNGPADFLNQCTIDTLSALIADLLQGR